MPTTEDAGTSHLCPLQAENNHDFTGITSANQRGVLRSGASKRGQNMALLHLWQCRKWNDSLLTPRSPAAPQAATQAWEEGHFFYSFGKTVFVIIMQ